MFKKSLLAAMVLSLTGCVFAPGMKMASPPEKVQEEASQFQIKPTFVAITPELIQKMPQTQNDNYYYIGPQDVLNINVWDHPEFSLGGEASANVPTNNVGMAALSTNSSSLTPSAPSGGFLVNPDGTIYFPLVGTVHVQGETSDQIRAQMTTLLTKYIRNPQVDVRVAAFRNKRLFVMGEVNKPGLLNVNDIPTSITDAINLAGGLNQDTADPAKIYVIRGDIAKPTVYWLDAEDADALLLGERFRLENNDILFISTAGVARWNRAISQIMPTIQSYFYTAASIQQTRL